MTPQAPIVACPGCQMQFDASQLAPGAQFQCTNCGTLVTYGQQAQAPRPRAGIPQRGPGAPTRGPMPGARGPARGMPQQQQMGQGNPYGGRALPPAKKSNTGVVIGIVGGLLAVVILIVVLASGGGGSSSGLSPELQKDVDAIMAISNSNQPVLSAEQLKRVREAIDNNMIPQDQVGDLEAQLSVAEMIRKSHETKQANADYVNKRDAADKAARQAGDGFYAALRAGNKPGMAKWVDFEAYHQAIQGKLIISEPLKTPATWNHELQMKEDGQIVTINYTSPMGPGELQQKGFDYLVEMYSEKEGRTLSQSYAQDPKTNQIVRNHSATSDYYEVAMELSVNESDETYKLTKPIKIIIRGKWGGPAKINFIGENSQDKWVNRHNHPIKFAAGGDGRRRAGDPRVEGEIIEGEEGTAGPTIPAPPARSDYDGSPTAKRSVESIANSPMERVIKNIRHGSVTAEDHTLMSSYVQNPATLSLFFSHLANNLLTVKQIGQEAEKQRVVQGAWRLVERTCSKTIGPDWTKFCEFIRGADDKDGVEDSINQAAWRYSKLAEALEEYAKMKDSEQYETE